MTMTCKQCIYYSREYGFCRVESTKPAPTGEPRTCSYYKRKE